MTSKHHQTPMLDEPENGEWPTFVSGIKRLRDEHQSEQIQGKANAFRHGGGMIPRFSEVGDEFRERIRDWIGRIGWPQFFELTGLPFTPCHVDIWRGARNSLNTSTHICFQGGEVEGSGRV